jgi:hypothetical protein
MLVDRKHPEGIFHVWYYLSRWFGGRRVSRPVLFRHALT